MVRLQKEDVPPDWPYTFDPQRSRKLLAEAGLPNGFNIDVFISEREEYKTNLLIVQEQLRKVGIQINMRLVDHASYHVDIRRDLDPMVVYGTGQPPLTQAILNAFYDSRSIVGKPTHNMNFSHFGDVAGNVDALIDQAHQEVDDTKRLALLKEIQMQILQQVPVVPLPSPAGTWVHNPRLEIGFPVKAFMGTFTLGKRSVRRTHAAEGVRILPRARRVTILRRGLEVIPTVLLVLTLVFLALRILPGDPAIAALGEYATPEAIATFRQKLGLDQPLWLQYLSLRRPRAHRRFRRLDDQRHIDQRAAAQQPALHDRARAGRDADRYRDRRAARRLGRGAAQSRARCRSGGCSRSPGSRCPTSMSACCC